MTKQTCLALLPLLFSGSLLAQTDVHWGYSGAQGPEHWGALAPEFALCASGKHQTPIDIQSAYDTRLAPLAPAYQAGGNEILNNGHTVQVNYAAGSQVHLDSADFMLKQFHFHAPSENYIDGHQYPMEIHLVHADAQGNLAVLGLMVEEGAANPLLDTLWAAMPQQAGEHQVLATPVNVADLLPQRRDYYRFAGSLTTPPCSEGVRWLVLKNPIQASKAQIARFAAVMGHPNNRPLQAINARVLVD